MNAPQTFIVVVTDKVPASKLHPDGFIDRGTVHFTREDADKAYRNAVSAGCYGASVCLVLESTDY